MNYLFEYVKIIIGVDYMVSLVYGIQDVRVHSKVDEIVKNYLDDINEFTCVTVDAEKISLQDIVSDANTLPFGFDKKVVIIKNPYFLGSSKEPKLPFDVDYDVFIDYLKQDSQDSMIILSYVGEIDNRKSLVKNIKGYAKVYELSNIEKNEWNVIAKRLFNDKGIKVSDDTISFFIGRINNDLGLMMREVEKLSLYSKVISKEDVEALVSRPLEENSFMMVDAIINNDLNSLLTIYNDLKLQNEEPTRILAMLTNQLSLQYQVSALAKDHSEKQIASILNIHPYRTKLMLQKRSKINNNDIMYIIDKMAELDLKIKTGEIDKYQGIELFFIKIAG